MPIPVPGAADLSYEAIRVGTEAEFSCVVTAEDVRAFANLSGDYNPLHIDPDYARTTRLGRCIVHGMLLAGLFSRLLGMYLPGRRCLYLSQNTDFVHPVYAGDRLRVVGVVHQKQDATRSLTIRTSIANEAGVTVVRGKAHAIVLDNL